VFWHTFNSWIIIRYLNQRFIKRIVNGILFFRPLFFLQPWLHLQSNLSTSKIIDIKYLLKKIYWLDVIILATSFCNRVCIRNQIYQLPKSLTLKIFKSNWRWDLNLLATSFCDCVCICNQIHQLPKSLTSKIKEKLLVGC